MTVRQDPLFDEKISSDDESGLADRDVVCRTILRHNVDAMGPDSRLLIAEVLVPDRVQKEELYCYWMDLTVLTFAGRERSEADWRDLFESVGLALVKVWRAEVGTQAVVEGRLRR